MAKRKYETGYYDIRNLMVYAPNLSYYIAFGGRRGGKTWSSLDYAIDQYQVAKDQFVYVRRYKSQVVKRKMMALFGFHKKQMESKLHSTIEYDPNIGFYITPNGQKEVIGYCASIENAFNDKGVQSPYITTIIIDEFLDYVYFQDEIRRFLHLIANYTTPENKHKVKVIMIANNVEGAKLSPYFSLFKLDVDTLRQGEKYYFEHKKGVRGVVEYMANRLIDTGEKDSDSHPLLGFDDDETANMILYGEWEYSHVQTRSIDGIGWSKTRHLIPLYITCNGKTYEISLYTNGIPITFVRSINVQDGKVRSDIKYNLTTDRTVILTNKNGIVPSILCINSLIDNSTIEKWSIVLNCFQCGRILFDTPETGTAFIIILDKLKKGGY